ncbi:MAG: damage-control phosphatase ARMT1 family protein [Planctomycetota bacterium]|jgi:uncharacterized protein with ATP-grasp and redox domains
MKAVNDCIVCMFNQALNTARVVTDDPEVHNKVLIELGKELEHISLDTTPAAVSQPVYEIVSRVTGIADPYKMIKEETNKEALSLLPMLEKVIYESSDKLKAAIHLAVAGNIIDLGIGHEFNLEEDVLRIMNSDFSIDSYREFKKEIKSSPNILYLGDNSGEIVFDRVLVEQLLQNGCNVKFSVKSGPVINDATMEDAETAGLTELVEVIETGSSDIGINWNNCSDEFKDEFIKADLIISKGQGNFETCNTRPENIYFILKAKCNIVADELGVNFGDIVFKHY